jgi:hypothetical protein
MICAVTEWLSCETVWISHVTDEHDSMLGELPSNPGGGSTLIPRAFRGCSG